MSRTSADEVSTQAVSPVSIFGAAAPSCAHAAAAIPSKQRILRSNTLLFLGIFVSLSKVKNPRGESPRLSYSGPPVPAAQKERVKVGVVVRPPVKLLPSLLL